MPSLSLQAAPGTYITSASTVIAILRTKTKREIIKGNVNFKLINKKLKTYKVQLELWPKRNSLNFAESTAPPL